MNNSTLTINPKVKADLLSIAKWSKFFSIIGFIMSAIIILGGIISLVYGNFMSNSFSTLGVGMIGLSILYLAMGLVYIYPCLCMFKSANAMKLGVLSDMQVSFEEGFAQMNKYFTFFAYFTIIILALYIIAIIIAIVLGVAGFM